jgi:hypothetical protein
MVEMATSGYGKGAPLSKKGIGVQVLIHIRAKAKLSRACSHFDKDNDKGRYENLEDARMSEQVETLWW